MQNDNNTPKDINIKIDIQKFRESYTHDRTRPNSASPTGRPCGTNQSNKGMNVQHNTTSNNSSDNKSK